MKNLRLFLILSLFLSHIAWALEEDKNQPLYVQADSVSVDNMTGVSQYIGNVSAQQGSSHLTAQKATIYLEEKTIQKAIAEGDKKTQAHYWGLLDPKKPELHAFANIIEVYPQKNLIILIGNARVSQGEDSYSAPRIEYNTKEQRAFSPKSTNGRTIIVIHPNQNALSK